MVTSDLEDIHDVTSREEHIKIALERTGVDPSEVLIVIDNAFKLLPARDILRGSRVMCYKHPRPYRYNPFGSPGIDISNIIIELLAITQWGSLDYLIIDMPPGIGDETLDVIRLIKNSEFLVISTPSKVSMGAVSKLLRILKELKLPIIGVIENMKMDETSYIKDTVSEMNLPYLNSIYFDKDLEQAIGFPDKLLETKFMKNLDKIITETIVRYER